jgi:thiol-disulfide isomerase/thioredoxin
MAQKPATPDPLLLIRQSADVLSDHRSYRRESITTTDIHGSLAPNGVGRSEVQVSVALRRPDRLRIQSGPEGARMTMVSDGSHSWMYLESSGEYIERSAGASPVALLQDSGFMKQLPDFGTALQSATVKGEETVVVGKRSFPCWIVVKRYGTIQARAQGMTLRDATETLWIAKSEHVALKNVVQAKVSLANRGGRAEIVQTTRTLALELDAELPDSMFTFTPPKGAKQIADWNLPGISRPDVVGKPAPPLLADAIGGGRVDLAALRGRAVLLDFWATWCGPCRLQLLILDKLHKEMGSSGLSVIGVTVGEEPGAVSAFLKNAGLSFPNAALDEESAFVQRFGVNSFPTTILIDREGIVVSYEVGQQTEDVLRAQIARLKAGNPAAANQ